MTLRCIPATQTLPYTNFATIILKVARLLPISWQADSTLGQINIGISVNQGGYFSLITRSTECTLSGSLFDMVNG